jgi:hypothetical protein
MLKVCIVVDVEDFISFRRKNPEWTWWQNLKLKINSLLAPIRYERQGYEKIYSLVVKESFPISFMLVGSLFRPKEKKSFIDYGYHTWNHLPLTYINNARVEREVKNIYGCKTFSPPMELIEDPKTPGRILKALKKEGYRICVWAGPTIRDEKEKLVIIKEPRKKIASPARNYIKCVYVSNSFEGTSSLEHLRSIINEVKKNSKKNAVYCLVTHDFRHKNLKNIWYLMQELKKLQEMGKIKIVNLSQL